MDTHLERRAAEIFKSLLERSDAMQREALIERACGGDAKLRAAVEALLAADARPAAGTLVAGASVLTDDSDAAAANTHVSPSGERPGTIIGRYKLLELIGQGGFGSVWMAEQREPVKRRVALKVIKLGMDTRQVVARFEAERQALALMDHPNIAKVLDGGATESGRPYFVMELVRGIPITDFCDHELIDTKRRLELFAQVCNAVQHAHTKGVIHRDIKPSNVLVTLHDGLPVPKVIDFGIAKATNAELTEKTLFTEHRQMIGTPAYMSPEQAEMSGLDIDTRSDVYSLGVLLYELLTGTPPFDPEKLRSAGYAEMVRIIREEEPQRPSLRLSSLGERLTSVSRSRQLDPRRLRTLLRGELDWIVMKCLEKDRARRYETANGVAADVRRYLTGEAIEARRHSLGYVLRKLAHRYKAQASMVVLLASVVLTALFFVTYFFFSADFERMKAVQARDQAFVAQEQERRAREKADAATADAEKQRGAAERMTAALYVFAKQVETDHFIVYYTTSRDAANELASHMERIYRQNVQFLEKLELAPRVLVSRLEVFYFEEWETFVGAGEGLGIPAKGMLGFYLKPRNWCIFCEPSKTPTITDFDAQIREVQAAGDEQALRRIVNRRKRLLSKLTEQILRHETAHAVQYNIGPLDLQTAAPSWLVEGLALLFEPLEAWNGLNRERAIQLRSVYPPDPQARAEKLKADVARWFSGRPTGGDDAGLWALTHYLTHTQAAEFAAYLRDLPNLDAASYRIEFERRFGPIDELVVGFSAYIGELQEQATSKFAEEKDGVD